MLRVFLVFLHDVVAAGAAWFIAHWLRFNMEITPFYTDHMLRTLVWVVPAQTFVFWAFGLYRGIWRYASLQDLKRLLVAIAIAAFITPFLLFVVGLSGPVPRTVLLLDPILLLLIMSGSRLSYRVYKEHDVYGALRYQGKPVLVLGAGDTALTLLRELERSPAWRVVGFLDDDPGKVGRLVNGVKVYGRISDLPEVAQRIGVQHAIVAMPGATHEARRQAVQACSDAKLKALTVPSYDDLVSGRVTVSALRDIELDDLLGRDPVVLDDAGLHQLLTGRVVMVSGAGGSIGSELCREIARFEPKLLVMFELGEFALYSINEDLTERSPALAKVCVIGDVKDEARAAEVLGKYRPGVVFHAAAYKHVPLMEEENAWLALQNNVLGTYTLAAAAAAHGVERFVLISTDKAVNPVNVMGASKRLAEQVCQALQQRTSMRLMAVRFGNVLGSTGSVIPKFREQLARGGPVTVTHPDIIRYFMSIPEAAQLVLQAGAMGNGGEVFLLDMGKPVRIADLARDMIRLSGMSEDEVKITYTGLRPGEKLFEELMGGDEESIATPHPKVRIVRLAPPAGDLLDALIPWLRATRTLSDDDTRLALTRWVAEYQPASVEPAPASRSVATAHDERANVFGAGHAAPPPVRP
ncbi:MAG: polysaccharide biosynthesis protein [Burkholderiales bacterium]